MSKSEHPGEAQARNRFVSLSDEEILAAWCMCTGRREDDRDFRSVSAELKRRKIFIPFN